MLFELVLQVVDNDDVDEQFTVEVPSFIADNIDADIIVVDVAWIWLTSFVMYSISFVDIGASIEAWRELRLLLVVDGWVVFVGDMVCWDSVSVPVIDDTSGELSALVVVAVVVVELVGMLFMKSDEVSEDGDGAENWVEDVYDGGVSGCWFCCW